MDEKGENTGTATFISGFLFGILAGLLFTTRKGRKLLRLITDGEITKFSEIEAFLEQKMHKEDERTLIGDVVDDGEIKPKKREVVEPQASFEDSIKDTAQKTQAKVRRFFKGVKKRKN